MAQRVSFPSHGHDNRAPGVQTDTYYTPESYRFKVEFVYDGQGRLRIKRNHICSGGGWYGSGGETRYLYDGMLIVQERDSGNTPTVTYTRGRDLSGSLDGAGGIGGLLARSHGYSSGSWAYHNFYHADGNGNITALVNSSGTVQASYIYDAYGRYLTGTGTLSSGNVMRFSSKPWVSFLGTSATSGLYYYGYRFYDPYLQRWLNRDPINELGGINLYVMVGNDPINAYDKYGLLPHWLVGMGGGCAVGAVGSLIGSWVGEDSLGNAACKAGFGCAAGAAAGLVATMVPQFAGCAAGIATAAASALGDSYCDKKCDGNPNKAEYLLRSRRDCVCRCGVRDWRHPR